MKRDRIFAQLFNYADDKRIEENNLVLIYPKLVYKSLECLQNDPETLSEDKLRDCLNKSEKALTMLRSAFRLFYITDLLKAREMIKCRINNMCKTASCTESCTDTPAGLWEDLSLEYGISLSTDDWCYLYNETGVLCAGDVIQRRRKMLGMSREDLADGICSVKTLERAEKLRTDLHITNLSALFDRLHMPNEYRRAYFSENGLVQVMSDELVISLFNSGRYEDAQKELDRQKQRYPRTDIIAWQNIDMLEALISFCIGHITASEFTSALASLFKRTVPTCSAEPSIYYYTAIEFSISFYALMIAPYIDDRGIRHPVEDVYASFSANPESCDIRKLSIAAPAEIRMLVREGRLSEAEAICDTLAGLELSNMSSFVLANAFMERVPIIEARKKAGVDVSAQKEKNSRFLEQLKEYISDPNGYK